MTQSPITEPQLLNPEELEKEEESDYFDYFLMNRVANLEP